MGMGPQFSQERLKAPRPAILSTLNFPTIASQDNDTNFSRLCCCSRVDQKRLRMLRRSPNASAVAGVTAFLFICIMTWSMRSSTINFSSKSDGVQSSSTSRQSRGERVEDLGQRILTESAPRVALPPDSSNLKDIQNATLGVRKIRLI